MGLSLELTQNILILRISCGILILRMYRARFSFCECMEEEDSHFENKLRGVELNENALVRDEEGTVYKVK